MTDRELMQQALEAMGAVGADHICQASHHAKKDQHQWNEPCPLQQRWHIAFQALRERLAQPEFDSALQSAAMTQTAAKLAQPEQWEQLYPDMGNPLDRMAENARELGLDYEPVQEPVAHSIVAGALFDFMGWLTSRRKRIVLSGADDASPAAVAIHDFAEMRGLILHDPKVQEWQEHLTAPQPEQEPVAMRYDFDGYGYRYIDSGSGSNWQTRIKDAEPLYDTPPRREWVGLTEEEKAELDAEYGDDMLAHLDAIEARLKEKNQ